MKVRLKPDPTPVRSARLAASVRGVRLQPDLHGRRPYVAQAFRPASRGRPEGLRYVRGTTDVAGVSRYDRRVELNGPTVLWRLHRPPGGRARAVLLPGDRPTLTFFVNDVLDRAENYDGEDLALFRAEDVRQSLLSEGWEEDA